MILITFIRQLIAWFRGVVCGRWGGSFQGLHKAPITLTPQEHNKRIVFSPQYDPCPTPFPTSLPFPLTPTPAASDALPPRVLLWRCSVYGPSVHMQDYFKDPKFPANLPEIWMAQWGFAKELTGTDNSHLACLAP